MLFRSALPAAAAAGLPPPPAPGTPTGLPKGSASAGPQSLPRTPSATTGGIRATLTPTVLAPRLPQPPQNPTNIQNFQLPPGEWPRRAGLAAPAGSPGSCGAGRALRSRVLRGPAAKELGRSPAGCGRALCHACVCVCVCVCVCLRARPPGAVATGVPFPGAALGLSSLFALQSFWAPTVQQRLFCSPGSLCPCPAPPLPPPCSALAAGLRWNGLLGYAAWVHGFLGSGAFPFWFWGSVVLRPVNGTRLLLCYSGL